MGTLSNILGGINKFSNELIAPTTGLGKLGMYLGAAGGGDLGTASLAALKDQRNQQETELERQIKLLTLQHALRPQPHYFESNNGDQMAIGDDGKATTLYHDPTPKVTWIQVKDPTTGQVTLYPQMNGGIMGGVPQPNGDGVASPQPGAADLPAGYTLRKGGAGQPTAQTPFPIR